MNCIDFRVCFAGFVMVALADNTVVRDNHTSHKWIWVGLSAGFPGQLNTSAYVKFVVHGYKKHPTYVERYYW